MGDTQFSCSRVASVLAGVLLAACSPPQAPVARPADVGDTCAIGQRTTAACLPILACVPKPVAPRPSGDAGSDPFLSSEGGACGGVAGYHCLDGLECDMTPDQSAAADGMGRCARTSVCARR